MSRYRPSVCNDPELTRAVEADICAWLEAMPRDMRFRKHKQHPPRVRHPDPHEENGLPDGWVIYSRFVDFRMATDLVLVRRAEGDWVVVSHHRNAGSTAPFIAFRTLKEVFDYNLYRANPDVQTARFTVWLRRVFLRCYDPTDAADASELMLVALGSEVSAVPTALT
jgi:hypothetical protein